MLPGSPLKGPEPEGQRYYMSSKLGTRKQPVSSRAAAGSAGSAIKGPEQKVNGVELPHTLVA